MRPSVLSACLCILAFAPALTFQAAHAQEAPSPSGPPPASNAPAPSDDDAVATLNVNVNLVNLYMSIHDKDGFVTNLRKGDCLINEDKVPQTIKNFTQEKN